MRTLKATFTLPEDILDSLSEISKDLGEKKSHVISAALSQYFDILDLEIAKRRSDEIKSGKIKTIPLGDIEKEFDI